MSEVTNLNAVVCSTRMQETKGSKQRSEIYCVSLSVDGKIPVVMEMMKDRYVVVNFVEF